MPKKYRGFSQNSREGKKAGSRSWKRRVAAIHGTKCFYCKAELVILADVERKHRIYQDGEWVTYFDKTTQRGVRKLIFTLDHVIELSRGGKTDLTNLVPACHKCNNRRSNGRNRRRKPSPKAPTKPAKWLKDENGAWNLG